jgi:hypothetical protein
MAHIQMSDCNPSDFGIIEPVNPTIAGGLFAQCDELDELSDEDLQYFVGGTLSLSADDGVVCVTTTTTTTTSDGTTTTVTETVCTYS